MELCIFQKGFNFSQDGPGNRLVYHLQGCNLRCPWCSNPEGLAMEGGWKVRVEDMIQEAVRSIPMFFDGGGVTLTGGEVTMQADGVRELLKGLKAAAIHTCIETNGLSRNLPEILPLVDYLIIDCKHYLPDIHRKVTGQSNENLFENIRTALSMGKAPAVRIPVIGGFNDGVEAAEGFADLFCSLGLNCCGSVELLPYHEYGKDKYHTLGIPYAMTERAYVSPETIREMRAILESRGIRTIQT